MRPLTLKRSATPHALFLVLVLFFVGLIVSFLTPPFQSPDEDMHIKRAYLLSQGQVWLSTPRGAPTGGQINEGLLQFTERFSALPFHAERQLTANELYEANQILWSQSSAFSPTTGASFYFPLIYTPQAIGLGIGRIFDFKVATSYLLAKIFALICSCLLIYWALHLFPFSTAALGLLVLPMSLFQIGSASIDGVANGLSLLAISLFLKLSQSREQTPYWVAYTLALAIGLLTTSRMHLLPLILFILLADRITKQKRYRWLGAGVIVFTVLWLASVIRSTVDTRVRSSLSTSETLYFYLTHPGTLCEVFFNTLSNSGTLKAYGTSFMGVLGWLDASLPKYQYVILGITLCSLVISCLNLKSRAISRATQITLAGCAFTSVLIIFASLLIQWTPHPATQILGVQGRYFLVPTLLILVAFTRPLSHQINSTQSISLVLLGLLALCGTIFTNKLLLQRYYLMPEQSSVKIGSASWTKPLPPNQEIPIIFSLYQTSNPSKLRGISIYADTLLQSKGTLYLKTGSDQITALDLQIEKNLSPGYLYIPVPTETYTSGKLNLITGEGFRIKGITSNGAFNPCIIYELNDGSRRYTPGCP
jgi:uncharacterized membrane protein